jgi:hypothetical protein
MEYRCNWRHGLPPGWPLTQMFPLPTQRVQEHSGAGQSCCRVLIACRHPRVETGKWQSCGRSRVDLGCPLTRVAERLMERL